MQNNGKARLSQVVKTMPNVHIIAERISARQLIRVQFSVIRTYVSVECQLVTNRKCNFRYS